MSLGQIVLLAYAILMIAGGVMGYATAGSKPSLFAGVGSGVVLIAAWILTRSSPTAGLWLGCVVALLLCVSFAMRLAKTAKFMPSGMLLVVSVAALVLLTVSALRAQGKL